MFVIVVDAIHRRTQLYCTLDRGAFLETLVKLPRDFPFGKFLRIPFYFGIILQVYDLEIVYSRQFNELFVSRASRLHDSYR